MARCVSSRDAVRDPVTGAPVTGADGRYVTDKTAPRTIAFNAEGLIWDAGVVWRTNRRTALNAYFGRRYGSDSYFGSFSYAPTARSSLNISVYDSINGVGGQLSNALAALPTEFEAVRNPFNGALGGCVAANGDVDDYDNIRQFAVAYLRNEQDKDLQAFNLHFDEYYLESSLYTSGRVEATVNKLVANGKTYEQDGALWLKSTDYGDDKDRVMRKGDGTYTYFVPDVAYHIAKWERGFTKVVNIQGMDHHGTIARVRAGLQAANVGIPQGYPDYVLHTMVRVMRGGEEVKISKRAGSYVTLRDLIEWTSKDAVRFFLLSRKPDTEYIFDIDLALAQNNDNPVYYVQYAHARICSVLTAWGGEKASLTHADLSALQSPQAHALMLALAKYPEMLTSAAHDFAPHDVTFYLRELASLYHSYYDAERILVDDEAVKKARLALVAATAQVLHNGLKVLGVSAPTKM